MGIFHLAANFLCGQGAILVNGVSEDSVEGMRIDGFRTSVRKDWACCSVASVFPVSLLYITTLEHINHISIYEQVRPVTHNELIHD